LPLSSFLSGGELVPLFLSTSTECRWPKVPRREVLADEPDRGNRPAAPSRNASNSPVAQSMVSSPTLAARRSSCG